MQVHEPLIAIVSYGRNDNHEFPLPAEYVDCVRRAGGYPLLLPPGDGPHPAALLLTGSGAQDRDEAVFGHRPFLVLADRLTRAGIAVLRLDDRGTRGSTGVLSACTLETLAQDALAAMSFLARRGRRPARCLPGC